METTESQPLAFLPRENAAELMKRTTDIAKGSMSGLELVLTSDEQMKVHKMILKRSIIDWKTGCWNWSLGLGGGGYPYMRWKGKKIRINRLGYAAMRKITPAGLQVCHSCDNRACANPAHYFIGTQRENTMDAVRKGRQKLPGLKGEKSPNARLTTEKVLQIRALCGQGISQSEIAERFAIGQQSVSRIKLKKEWSHV